MHLYLLPASAHMRMAKLSPLHNFWWHIYDFTAKVEGGMDAQPGGYASLNALLQGAYPSEVARTQTPPYATAQLAPLAMKSWVLSSKQTHVPHCSLWWSILQPGNWHLLAPGTTARGLLGALPAEVEEHMQRNEQQGAEAGGQQDAATVRHLGRLDASYGTAPPMGYSELRPRLALC